MTSFRRAGGLLSLPLPSPLYLLLLLVSGFLRSQKKSEVLHIGELHQLHSLAYMHTECVLMGVRQARGAAQESDLRASLLAWAGGSRASIATALTTVFTSWVFIDSNSGGNNSIWGNSSSRRKSNSRGNSNSGPFTTDVLSATKATAKAAAPAGTTRGNSINRDSINKRGISNNRGKSYISDNS